MRNDDLKRVAKSRADHMPGETAGGRIERAGVRPGKTGDSRRSSPSGGEGKVMGIRGLPRSGLDLGNESTGGQAAEQAIGARPGESGKEINDRTER